jgi:hypothetical protein
MTMMAAVFWVALSVVVSFAATAPSPRGDAVLRTFALRARVGRETVRVKARKGGLRGIALRAKLVPTDDPGRSDLEVSLRNDADRALVGPLAAARVAGSRAVVLVGAAEIPAALVHPGTVTPPTRWRVRHGRRRSFRLQVALRGGVPLAVGEGATIEGPGGAFVQVEAGTFAYEVLLRVAPAPTSDPFPESGDLQLAAAIDLQVEPTHAHAGLPAPSKPLVIGLAADLPQLGADEELVVAQVVRTGVVSESDQLVSTELVSQLVPTASALIDARGRVASSSTPFPGVFSGGRYGFYRAARRMTVRGVVRGSQGPQSGVLVGVRGVPTVAITDATGVYVLAVPAASSVVVVAVDALRGLRGTVAAGVGGAPPPSFTVDVPLGTLPAGVILRDGLRNGGFESGDGSGWTFAAGALVHSGPFACSDGSIAASEGAVMASVATGTDGLGSTLHQDFVVPAGARRLSFSYDVASSEFTSGQPTADMFSATVIAPGGETTVVSTDTLDPNDTFHLGDCGDGNTWSHRGWQSASVDLSGLGESIPTLVRIVFGVRSSGDAFFPTRVFVDDVRFSTIWVDAKALVGASTTEAAAVAQVRRATEILSQSGVNVRLRRFTSVFAPPALLDLDARPLGYGDCPGEPFRQEGELTGELRQLLAIGRSPTPTDTNLWFVRSLTGLAALALAIGPDDFCRQVTIAENSGAILRADAGSEVLAHELGHLLLSPQSAGHALEHGTGPGNFMLTNSPPLGVMTREQSANINQPGAPLLAP